MELEQLSFAVMVYVPAGSPSNFHSAIGFCVPTLGEIEKVTTPTLPLKEIIEAVPVFGPLQVTFVDEHCIIDNGAFGCVIVTLVVAVQPFASVTVTV